MEAAMVSWGKSLLYHAYAWIGDGEAFPEMVTNWASLRAADMLGEFLTIEKAHLNRSRLRHREAVATHARAMLDCIAAVVALKTSAPRGKGGRIKETADYTAQLRRFAGHHYLMTASKKAIATIDNDIDKNEAELRAAEESADRLRSAPSEDYFKSFSNIASRLGVLTSAPPPIPDPVVDIIPPDMAALFESYFDAESGLELLAALKMDAEYSRTDHDEPADVRAAFNAQVALGAPSAPRPPNPPPRRVLSDVY